MSQLKFNLGDKVFAKMKGYCVWPAKVEGVADTRINRVKYHVYFYGTKQMGICQEDKLFSYNENKVKLGKPRKIKSFNVGMEEIEADNNPSGLASEKIQPDEITVGSIAEEKGPVGYISEVKETVEVTIGSTLEKIENDKICAGPTSDEVEVTVGPALEEMEADDVTLRTASEEIESDEVTIPLSSESVNKLNLSGVCSKNTSLDEPFEEDDKCQKVLLANEVEIEMVNTLLTIESCLTPGKADIVLCIQKLNELINLELTPIMIKKHSGIVSLLTRLMKYRPNLEAWQIDEKSKPFLRYQAKLINYRSKIALANIKSLLNVPQGTSFKQFFTREMDQFKKDTVDMSDDEFYSLI